MSISGIYNSDADEQAARVKRFANNSIWSIWIAGMGCMLIFVVYFLILPAKAENRKPIGMLDTALTTDELFNDKTSLVNIGLRMQEIPDNSREEKPLGTIRINKVIFEKKLINTKKRSTPDFFIRAVPK